MLRISGITAALNLFGLGKHGFRDGNKATGVVATKLTAEVFNAWQEEIATVIEHNGIVLDSASNAQLLAALKKMQGSLAGVVGYDANVNLGAGDVGKLVYFNGTSNLTATLPSPGSVKNGDRIQIVNLISAEYTCTVLSDSENINSNGLLLSSRIVPKIGSVSFVSDGVGTWFEDGQGAAFGIGQTWKSYTSPARQLNTDYLNSTGRAIAIQCGCTPIGLVGFYVIYVNGLQLAFANAPAGSAFSLFAIVPPGAFYSFSKSTSDTTTALSWSEMR